jgi:molybdenum cofactor guanylyltransferase
LHGGKLGVADHGGNDKYSTFSAKAGSGNRQVMSGILGVLLAGGRSSRMGGGDKCLAMLHGQTLLTRAIARARPQVSELILNANGDAARFLPFGLTIVPDVIEGQAGPLAGILSALEWAREHRPSYTHVASFATDTPFFPSDLVARLLSARKGAGAPIACAASGGRIQPVFGLWPVSLAGDLRRALTQENLRKVEGWSARHGAAQADFSVEPFDPFLNINSPDDLAAAERLASVPDRDFES